jgi:hypothetical protein
MSPAVKAAPRVHALLTHDRARTILAGRLGRPRRVGAEGGVVHATWWRGEEPWSLSLTADDDGLRLTVDDWTPGPASCPSWPLTGASEALPLEEALGLATAWLADRGVSLPFLAPKTLPSPTLPETPHV